MRNASNIRCMTSSNSKTPVFVRPHVSKKQAFSKFSTLENVFEKMRFRPTKLKYLRFQTKTDTCGLGLIVNSICSSNRNLFIQYLTSLQFLLPRHQNPNHQLPLRTTFSYHQSASTVKRNPMATGRLHRNMRTYLLAARDLLPLRKRYIIVASPICYL